MSTNQNGRRDGRALPPQELEACRRQVIEAHERGLSRREVSQSVGLSYSAVGNILKRYAEQGAGSIATVKRGSKPGIGRILSATQEQRLSELIASNSPAQLGLEFSTWRCQAVAQLVARECGLQLSQRTVWNYLSRWNISRHAIRSQPGANASALSA